MKKDEEWATFDEWSQRGAKIKKGSKATWFGKVPKFSSLQVEFRKITNYDVYGDLLEPDDDYYDAFDDIDMPF